MTNKILSASHRQDIVKYLAEAETSKDDLWYTRDMMWHEASIFGVDDLSTLSDAQYMECLRAVHDYWRRNQTQRNKRAILRGAGPSDATQRRDLAANYVGEHLRLFKYFDARVFQEELRGIHAQATPSSASERVFVLALQFTNNRMTNWSSCRNLPVEEQYAGPQYFGHRMCRERVEFVPQAFQCTHTPTVRPRSECPGWLCCSVQTCGKWRRVDADSLRIWDNRTFFSRQVGEARAFFYIAHIQTFYTV